MYITYVGICSPEFQFIFRSLYVCISSIAATCVIRMFVCVRVQLFCMLVIVPNLYISIVYSIPNSTLDCRLLTHTYTCVESSLNSIVLDL